MRVWLDDYRKMPHGFDVWAKTAEEAIRELETGQVTFISLDHDLAEEHYQSSLGYNETPTVATGYDVAKWIEEAVREGRIKMPGWACHSMNPVGRQRIEATMYGLEEL